MDFTNEFSLPNDGMDLLYNLPSPSYTYRSISPFSPEEKQNSNTSIPTSKYIQPSSTQPTTLPPTEVEPTSNEIFQLLKEQVIQLCLCIHPLHIEFKEVKYYFNEL